MAITPRSIVQSPLVLFLTLASLGALALGGAMLFTIGCPTQQVSPCQFARHAATPQPDLFGALRSGPCGNLLNVFPASLDRWEQGYWEAVVACLDRQGDSQNLIRVADRALQRFPKAEALYNVKGFHELELRRYSDAVTTLETGLEQVGNPSNGILENNLAWAGLWESKRVDPLRARELYQSSLRRDPTSCEAIHTGLWVEYSVASSFPSGMSETAHQNYRELRNDYARCTSNRLEYGADDVIVEVLGAGVLDYEMERVDAHRRIEEGHRVVRRPDLASALVGASLEEAFERFDRIAVDGLCDEAAPVRSALPACRALIRQEVAQQARPSFNAGN